MRNSFKILAVLLAGLAAGAVLGVLVAPGEGRENRGSLCDLIDEDGYSISETANNELWKLSKWRGRVVSFAFGLFRGPAPEMPDDLEHG